MKPLIFLLALTTVVACSSPAVDSPTATMVEPSAEPVVSKTIPPDLGTITSTPQKTATQEPTPTLSSSVDNDGVDIDQPVITLNQVGGFAGFDRTWVIYGDGRIIDPEENQVVVEQQLVTKLLERITALNFFNLEQEKPLEVCCDFFNFTLEVTDGQRINRITYSEGDSLAPATFFETVDEVRLFLEQAMSGGS